MRAEQPQHQAAGAAHKKEDRAREGEEGLHGRGDGQSNLLGALQGQGLWDQFAEDHVHVGDQAEGDDDGDGMGVDSGVGDFVDELHPFHQAGDHGLADPAQCQADHGDAQLNAVHDFVEMLVQALDDARADASRRDELLDAGIAHAHQGEFGCREEGIGRHQEQDQKDPEQHKGDHGTVILTFGSSWARRIAAFGADEAIYGIGKMWDRRLRLSVEHSSTVLYSLYGSVEETSGLGRGQPRAAVPTFPPDTPLS